MRLFKIYPIIKQFFIASIIILCSIRLIGAFPINRVNGISNSVSIYNNTSLMERNNTRPLFLSYNNSKLLGSILPDLGHYKKVNTRKDKDKDKNKDKDKDKDNRRKKTEKPNDFDKKTEKPNNPKTEDNSKHTTNKLNNPKTEDILKYTTNKLTKKSGPEAPEINNSVSNEPDNLKDTTKAKKPDTSKIETANNNESTVKKIGNKIGHGLQSAVSNTLGKLPGILGDIFKTFYGAVTAFIVISVAITVTNIQCCCAFINCCKCFKYCKTSSKKKNNKENNKEEYTEECDELKKLLLDKHKKTKIALTDINENQISINRA